MGSYTFSGEKFDDFSRIFQDITLIYMNLLSTKQNVRVESYVLGINTFTCRNARQCKGDLENTCKPDIHCALVAQWTCKEQWGKHECFHPFCKNFENFILCIPEHLFLFTLKLLSIAVFRFRSIQKSKTFKNQNKFKAFKLDSRTSRAFQMHINPEVNILK